ncbi:MAG TPA: HPF/RaiA family ribosome-associated protein [Polyangiaceae bacterium]
MPETGAAFARTIARPRKRTTGRGNVAETPLHVRAMGIELDDTLADHVRQRLGRKLRKFATHIERVSVRFDDVNGPRGGVDVVCRIKVVLSQLPSTVLEERGTSPRQAFDIASHAAERAVRRSLGRAGFSAGRGRSSKANPRRATTRATPTPPLPAGSLIGRRVGRSAANLERVRSWEPLVDTSRPGLSATDKKAGRGSTAARNVKLRTSRATAALEDSATRRPSRKSTRKSANRAKSGAKQATRARLKANSPKQRAVRQK